MAEPAYGNNAIFDYATIVDRMLAKPSVPYTRFPCVTPAWDNSARRREGGAAIFRNSTPELYERWLNTVVQKEIDDPNSNGIVFINAWNEWAEGNHLEPCQKWGHAYLEATQRVLQTAQSNSKSAL